MDHPLLVLVGQGTPPGCDFLRGGVGWGQRGATLDRCGVVHVVVEGTCLEGRELLRERLDEFLGLLEGSVDTFLSGFNQGLQLAPALALVDELLYLGGIHRHVSARVNRHAPRVGQLECVVDIRAKPVDPMCARATDLSRADEVIHLPLDRGDLLTERAASGLDGLSAPRQAFKVCSEVVTFCLQLALLVFTLHCVRLQRRRLPLLNVCPFHGFITEPRATSPIGACSPGV